MISRKTIQIVSPLLVLLIGISGVQGQPGRNELDRTDQQERDARQAALSRLSGTVAGGEDPQAEFWVRKDVQGFVRFLSAPVGGYFQVAGATGQQSPEEVADAFIAQNRPLLARDVNAVDFRRYRVGQNGGRSFIRYRQTYGGLEVHASTVIVQVNQGGGVGALVNDGMTDTRVLDEGFLSLTPTLDSGAAIQRAQVWMTEKYPGLTVESTVPELVIYSPEVMGLTGETRLTWRLEIGDSENTVRERLLVDAHTGEVAYHSFLVCSAFDLLIEDMGYDGTYQPTRREDSDPNLNYHSEVNRAFDYCSEAYEFFYTKHGRDGWNDGGGLLSVEVRSNDGPNFYNGTMRLPIGTITDDTVGHEFTHGVLYSEVGLDGYDQTESGAIMEALCDCWGEWIDQATDHDDRYDDIDDSALTYNADDEDDGDLWELFEDDPTISHPYRSMSNPTIIMTNAGAYGENPNYVRYQPAYYQDPSRWYSQSVAWNYSEDYQGHHNCGVGDKLGYLLSDEFGNSDAADLMYSAIQVLPQACDYYDLYFALAQAAINRGFSWNDRENVKTACEAVGIVPTSEQDDWALEGHWRLDESSGTTASDSIGSNHGTLNGGATWDGNGKLNGALSFDGTDDRVSLSAINALKGRSASISAWINASSVADQYDPIVTQYDSSSGDGYYLCLNYGKPTLYLGSPEAQDSSAITTSTWYHLVGVYNGIELRIYVDGNLENSVDEEDDEDVLNQTGVDHNAYIGWSGTGSYFNGLIDDVRVYNYALSENEIVAIYEYREYPRVFSVRDSSDALLAWIDTEGNLFLKGSLATQTTPSATANDEFRIQDSGSDDVGLIDMVNGDMMIKGTVHEEVSDWSAASHFIVKDNSNNIVAYIDNSGNLYLKGKAYSHSPEL